MIVASGIIVFSQQGPVSHGIYAVEYPVWSVEKSLVITVIKLCATNDVKNLTLFPAQHHARKIRHAGHPTPPTYPVTEAEEKG